MSTQADSKPWTVPALADAKRDKRKLVMLTAYDNSFARVLDANGVDLVLVGDSLGMVVQGHDSTLPVNVEDIVYHTAAVARGLQRALLVADMPTLKDACSTLYDGVTETHTVFHNDAPELNAAARSVVKRMSAGRFLWGGEGADMLEAATLASWGSRQSLPDYDVLDSIG
mgnify:CR=1 FL=1